MSTIPSTGSIEIDITIALIAGGAVTTWLTLLFDRLATRRAEYIDISKQKIAKISSAEIMYTHIHNYFSQVSRFLDAKINGEKVDYEECVYYIAAYLYELRKLIRTIGYYQLDDIYGEEVIKALVEHLFQKLKGSIGSRKTTALADMIDDRATLLSFVDDLALSIPVDTERKDVFNSCKAWLENLEIEEAKEISEKTKWYGILIIAELNLTYNIFYGGIDHIKKYYKTVPLDIECQKYLELSEKLVIYPSLVRFDLLILDHKLKEEKNGD